MNFKKILDGVNIQGYKIVKPNKAFKKLFPKRFIFSLDVMGQHVVFNTNEIPKNFCLYAPIGYVFTYDSRLPQFLISDKLLYQDVGGVFPSCLDEYFTATDKSVDLILSICPRGDIVPACFVNEIVVQCNSAQIMKGDLKNNILSVVENYLKADDGNSMNAEAWARKVIFNYPMNNNGLPVRYPKTVNDKTLKEYKIKADQLFVEYDFRASSYDKENEFVIELEDAFEDMNRELTIYENYNGLLKRIRSELDKKKLKYKVLNDVGENVDDPPISVKAKYLRELGLTYKMTDFI